MTSPAPLRLDFTLQGDRQHVRATDVLAALMAHFPPDEVHLRFLRPLAGPALLHLAPCPGAAVAGRIGAQRLALVPLPGAVAPREPAQGGRALLLALGDLYAFAFAPGTPAPAAIAAIFDRVHPRQAERFTVRQITLAAGPPRRSPVMGFRLRVAPDRTQAALALLTPLGRLARIEFRLTPRGPDLPEAQRG